MFTSKADLHLQKIERDLHDAERYREFLQERADFQAEQLKVLKDELASWRRLYEQRFDMLKGELSALNGWVATIAASHNLPLPQNIEDALDPDKVFLGEDGSVGSPSNADPEADMNVDSLLWGDHSPVIVDGDDGRDDPEHEGP